MSVSTETEKSDLALWFEALDETTRSKISEIYVRWHQAIEEFTLNNGPATKFAVATSNEASNLRSCGVPVPESMWILTAIDVAKSGARQSSNSEKANAVDTNLIHGTSKELFGFCLENLAIKMLEPALHFGMFNMKKLVTTVSNIQYTFRGRRAALGLGDGQTG